MVLLTSGILDGGFKSSVRDFLVGGGLSDSSTGAGIIAESVRNSC